MLSNCRWRAAVAYGQVQRSCAVASCCCGAAHAIVATNGICHIVSIPRIAVARRSVDIYRYGVVHRQLQRHQAVAPRCVPARIVFSHARAVGLAIGCPCVLTTRLNLHRVGNGGMVYGEVKSYSAIAPNRISDNRIRQSTLGKCLISVAYEPFKNIASDNVSIVWRATMIYRQIESGGTIATVNTRHSTASIDTTTTVGCIIVIPNITVARRNIHRNTNITANSDVERGCSVASKRIATADGLCM